MEPIVFGGGATQTTMSGAVMAMMAILALLILVLPRKYVIVPVLLGVFLIPQGDVLVVARAHLIPARLISLAGWIRLVGIKIISRTSLVAGGWNIIDTLFACWAICRSLAVVLLWASQAAVVNEIGHLWVYLGMYFLLRCLIQDDEDIQRVIKIFILIASVNAAGMLYEHFKVQNLFAIYLGGVQSVPFIRNGTIRSQGSFAHSILAGCFGATLMPLLIWLWKNGKFKILVVAGVIASGIMIATSGSSTPVLACTGAVVALCFWPLRKSMRAVRWGFVAVLIALALVMKAPVWFLIARVDVTGSSTGYFRATLIDQFVRHFSDWWLIGTKNNAGWGEDMWDLSNQFVAEGFSGGLLTFTLFVAMISRCFARIGDARKRIEGDKRQEWLMWLLGVALFAHIMAFFGVSYWDQMWIAWAALLAIITAATRNQLAPPEPTMELVGVPAAIGYRDSLPKYDLRPKINSLQKLGIPKRWD